ncbi:hypothetical protein AOT31_08210 [Corynebacterium ulcerans]|nr:hypothetical protein [Corynebacterium ulcerans]KPJ24148.1 hypothetical protein AOT31_08210 [Corynebacterium ulcerans]
MNQIDANYSTLNIEGLLVRVQLEEQDKPDRAAEKLRHPAFVIFKIANLTLLSFLRTLGLPYPAKLQVTISSVLKNDIFPSPTLSAMAINVYPQSS